MVKRSTASHFLGRPVMVFSLLRAKKAKSAASNIVTKFSQPMTKNVRPMKMKEILLALAGSDSMAVKVFLRRADGVCIHIAASASISYLLRSKIRGRRLGQVEGGRSPPPLFFFFRNACQ